MQCPNCPRWTLFPTSKTHACALSTWFFSSLTSCSWPHTHNLIAQVFHCLRCQTDMVEIQDLQKPRIQIFYPWLFRSFNECTKPLHFEGHRARYQLMTHTWIIFFGPMIIFSSVPFCGQINFHCIWYVRILTNVWKSAKYETIIGGVFASNQDFLARSSLLIFLSSSLPSCMLTILLSSSSHQDSYQANIIAIFLLHFLVHFLCCHHVVCNYVSKRSTLVLIYIVP